MIFNGILSSAASSEDAIRVVAVDDICQWRGGYCGRRTCFAGGGDGGHAASRGVGVLQSRRWVRRLLHVFVPKDSTEVAISARAIQCREKFQAASAIWSSKSPIDLIGRGCLHEANSRWRHRPSLFLVTQRMVIDLLRQTFRDSSMRLPHTGNSITRDD